MGNEPNKQQGQQGQSQSHQQEQQGQTGSNISDKWKSNQPQPGGVDPKQSQDMPKKDPSRQPGSTEHEQEESDQKRRAS